MFQNRLLDKGKVAFAVLLLTLFCGFMLMLLLIFGLGDPPRAGGLISEFTVLPTESVSTLEDSIDIFRIVNTKESVTLEASAINKSTKGSSWGFLIVSSTSSVTLLVDHTGYVSAVAELSPLWRPFVHVEQQRNRLYLFLDGAGQATYRINDEIAWEGQIDAGHHEISIIVYGEPHLDWEYIRVYGETS